MRKTYIIYIIINYIYYTYISLQILLNYTVKLIMIKKCNIIIKQIL